MRRVCQSQRRFRQDHFDRVRSRFGKRFNHPQGAPASRSTMKTMLPAIAIAAVCLRTFAADATVTNKTSRTGPFILGAEISWAPEDEADGAEYYDHGVRKDIFEILKEYKFNYIRLRLFVDPGAPDGYAM